MKQTDTLKTLTEPLTAAEMNNLKHILKELREAQPEQENYIQIIIEQFPMLSRLDYFQIYDNINQILSTGHYAIKKLPRLCPDGIIFC